jgi:DNA-binding MarR family transcriptional regulator
MDNENLIFGLGFALKHELTQKEMYILIPFLKKPYTAAQLAKELGINKITLHHTIQRLKLKQLITLKSRDAKGNNLYTIK